jgi:hypothetical protein
MRLRLLVLPFVLLVLALAPASAAAATSLVYIQGGNVFIANADGSNPHQVTTDGSTANPGQTAYRSPTEANDGTIVAAKGGELIHMRQNGVVLSHFVPDTGGYPLAAAVSPDGAKIAYNFSSITQCVVYNYSCGYYPEPGSAVTSASGRGSDPGAIQSNEQDGQWIDNSTLVLQNDTSYVDYEVLGQTVQHWFVPNGIAYAAQPVVSRSGAYLAVVSRPSSTGGNPSTSDLLQIYRMNGAPPIAPTLLCEFTPLNSGGFQRPDFAPDDSTIIWYDSAGEEATGIDPAACTGAATFSLSSTGAAFPGATEASFGLAANNPPPLPTTGPGSGSGGKKLAVSLGAVKSIKRTAILKAGLKAKLACSSACGYGVVIGAGNSVARKLKLTKKKHGSVVLGVKKGTAHNGKATVTVKLSGRARSALNKVRAGQKVVLIVEVQARAATGKTVIHDYRLTVTT